MEAQRKEVWEASKKKEELSSFGDQRGAVGEGSVESIPGRGDANARVWGQKGPLLEPQEVSCCPCGTEEEAKRRPVSHSWWTAQPELLPAHALPFPEEGGQHCQRRSCRRKEEVTASFAR